MCPNNKCSATFTRVSDLKRHERNMHGNNVKKPLKCKLSLVETIEKKSRPCVENSKKSTKRKLPLVEQIKKKNLDHA